LQAPISNEVTRMKPDVRSPNYGRKCCWLLFTLLFTQHSLLTMTLKN